MTESAKPKSLFKTIAKDAALTLGAEVIVLASFFVFYRLLANYFGPDGVGVYSLMRRVLAVAIPVVMLGLSEALGRYIAGTTEEAERSGFVVAGMSVVVSTSAVLALLLNISGEFSARWIFGDASYAHLIFSFTVLLIGLATHTFVYACLRGGLQIRALNSLQLLSLGILPPIILLVGRNSAFSIVIILIGLAHAAAAAVFFVAAVLPRFGLFKGYLRYLKTLLWFGAPRLVGALAGAALFSLGPILASHYVSISEVGYLSLSLALLIGVGSAAAPLGSVLLPHVSGLVSRGETERFERGLHLLIGAILQSLLFVVGQVMVFAGYLVTVWMGNAFLPAAQMMAVVFSSLVAYGFFVVARNILDAVSPRALNSINASISLGVMIIAMAVIVTLWPANNVALMFGVSFAVAFNILGILTYISVRKIFGFKMKEDRRHLLWGLALNACAIGAAVFAKQYVTTSLFLFIFFEADLLAAYIIALRLLGFEWVKTLEAKFLSARTL